MFFFFFPLFSFANIISIAWTVWLSPFYLTHDPFQPRFTVLPMAEISLLIRVNYYSCVDNPGTLTSWEKSLLPEVPFFAKWGQGERGKKTRLSCFSSDSSSAFFNYCLSFFFSLCLFCGKTFNRAAYKEDKRKSRTRPWFWNNRQEEPCRYQILSHQ